VSSRSARASTPAVGAAKPVPVGGSGVGHDASKDFFPACLEELGTKHGGVDWWSGWNL
jgi:hypothetical protein